MNRLKGNRCYLAGAMEFDDTNGVEWRTAIQRELEDLGICWLDPTDKPCDIGRETPETKQELFDAREAGDYDAVRQRMKPVCGVDLRMVAVSDFLVVNVDPNVPTWGTSEEISIANTQKKPVVIRVVGGKTKTPLWPLGRLPHQMIFSEWSEVHAYLRHIAHDKVIDRMNRWYFFNFQG